MSLLHILLGTEKVGSFYLFIYWINYMNLVVTEGKEKVK